MLIDGKKIAADIYAELEKKISTMETRPVLTVFLVGDDAASKKFVEMKEKAAEKIGIEFRLYEFETSIETDELISEIKRANTDSDVTGIIVQLPLPKHIDAERVCEAIDPNKDVDALGPEARVRAPVAVAVAEILKRHDVWAGGKRVVVVGSGKLVGQPVAVWLSQEGADVVVVNDKTKDISSILKTADIIVSGAGSPGLIKPEMLKQGVVLIDAGTSEQKGKLAGDADLACESVASLMTPVPGGVGPITVASLFKNLLELGN